MLLCDEISKGIEGEIDEQALEEKRSLFESRSHANNVKRLTRYGRASFAGTAAEYVHCLWHEVTVRTGPDYLPALRLQPRLEHWSDGSRRTAVIACSPRRGVVRGRLRPRVPVKALGLRWRSSGLGSADRAAALSNLGFRGLTPARAATPATSVPLGPPRTCTGAWRT